MATTTTMALPTDNLNPPPAPSRVYYALGRMLGVDDFQAEQDYHRGSLARALLQLCGTGTVAGLNVAALQIWQPGTYYPASAFVYDASQNVQVNTGTAGTSGDTLPAFATAAGGSVTDQSGIVWTNQGQVNSNGWRPTAPFTAPSVIVDSNNNLQMLNGSSTFTAGSILPVWSTAIGSTTLDGAPAILAWSCLGPAQLEIEVTPGLAVDRVGRMIEVPRTVCIRIQPWLADQALSGLNSFLTSGSGNILVDVFATFAGCTQGVTPCFATQDDYDATDAFTANRTLDSFAMQLVLRSDTNPQLPQDAWLGAGAVPAGAITAQIAQSLKQSILAANSGPAATPPFTSSGPTPVEIPPGFDPSSVFLARISIPATAGASGQPPNYNLNAITINNLSRLFLFPASLVARSIGLSSGAES
ncbi:MAG: hypothetical protein WCA21_07185 [Terracidiphilus sp.]